MTPAGIEPATFRFVAQHLKPLCYRGAIRDLLYHHINISSKVVYRNCLILVNYGQSCVTVPGFVLRRFAIRPTNKGLKKILNFPEHSRKF